MALQYPEFLRLLAEEEKRIEEKRQNRCVKETPVEDFPSTGRKSSHGC